MTTRKQCKKCPWKKSTNPNAIPNGYSVEKHRALKATIAGADSDPFDCGLKVMACHESEVGDEVPCVGWLANQLGEGNNVGLRFMAIRDRSLGRFELDGPQHRRFEDTLPEGDA